MSTLPFDHQDVRAVFETVFNELVFESDRGAALIAAELISDTLKSLLQDFFPRDFKSKEFLSYPGPLSSAGARADAAYAFRLIKSNVYRAITLLRRVRNAAAHSPSSFTLEAHADRLREVYEATVTPGDAVNYFARQFMAHRLAQSLRSVDSELGTSPKVYSEEEMDEILGRPEIARHLPKYQLAVAVSLICALIVYHKGKLLSVVREDTLVAEISDSQELGGPAERKAELATGTAPNPYEAPVSQGTDAP